MLRLAHSSEHDSQDKRRNENAHQFRKLILVKRRQFIRQPSELSLSAIKQRLRQVAQYSTVNLTVNTSPAGDFGRYRGKLPRHKRSFDPVIF